MTESTLLARSRRYTMVGIVCALTHNLIMIGGDAVGVHYLPATVLSFAVVTPLGYFLHCRFTFRKALSLDGFLRFMAGIALGYPISLGLMALFLLGLRPACPDRRAPCDRCTVRLQLCVGALGYRAAIASDRPGQRLTRAQAAILGAMRNSEASRSPTQRWIALLCLATITVGVAGGAAGAGTPGPVVEPPAASGIGMTADDVRHHLGHVIDWYHRLSGLGPSPVLTDDIVTRDRLRQTMLTEVRTAFRFGRAAAPLVSEAAPDPASPAATGEDPEATDSARYVRMSAGMSQRAQNADGADRHHRHAVAQFSSGKAPDPGGTACAARRCARTDPGSAADRQWPAAVRGQLHSKASGEKGLLADIADMERTVPESRLASGDTRTTANANDPAASQTTAVTTQVAPRSESGGLIAMTKEWLALRDAIALHAHYIEATEALSDALDKISSTLTGQVRELLQQVPAAATSTNAAQLASARASIDAATLRFRDLSTLLVPLGQESITIDAAQSLLWQRRGGLEQRSAFLLNAGLVRIAILGASILVILGLSALWRRATFRYLQDSRRRQQFLTLRRIVTALAMIVVIVFSFLTEIGSLATYIGFVTAGIAVALQNVILAVVAYFFLIGRYGVRVGDRITLAGVTGRVAEIGLVRLYLAELGGAELHPTGRMIVLSNAVIFQPSALFKQIPGIEYTWHSATLTIDPTADPQRAQARLQAAADAVYEGYRGTIERSVHSAHGRVDFESTVPKPEVNARFSEQGLEISVRYPVMPEESAQIDQQMSRALYEELEREPKLGVVKSA